MSRVLREPTNILVDIALCRLDSIHLRCVHGLVRKLAGTACSCRAIFTNRVLLGHLMPGEFEIVDDVAGGALRGLQLQR